MNENFEWNVLSRKDDHSTHRGKWIKCFIKNKERFNLTRHLSFMFSQKHIDHGFTIQVFILKSGFYAGLENIYYILYQKQLGKNYK